MRAWRLSGAAAVVGAVVVVVTAPLQAVGARADSSGSYTTTARADAFRVGVSATGFIVNDLTDTSGPTAQARVDSLGTSVGFASFLYPGDVIAGTPGLVASLVVPKLGLPPPDLPAYPLAVASQHPGQPSDKVDQPALSLSAESTAGSSTGHAAATGPDSGGNATGKAVADAASKVDSSGKPVADAASTVEAVTIASVLRIGRVVATAHAESSGTGAPVTRSSFSAEAMTVAGVPVALTEKGLGLAGSSVPLPPSSSVSQALAASGISVRYLAPVTSPGAIQSAGLVVTVVTHSPTGNKYTVVYTFGVVQAGIAGGMATPAPSVGDSFPAPAVPGGGASLPATAGTGATSPVPSAAPAASSAPRTSAGAAPRTAPLSSTSALSFYLVLVVGAAVAVSGSALLRHFAVRLAWTS
ncbi:MAG: hypothetical protein JWM05_1003 [Acidimicrobiales bacterium]|nr:hypothetical protein [Acidimicrobiales bacterium]